MIKNPKLQKKQKQPVSLTEHGGVPGSGKKGTGTQRNHLKIQLLLGWLAFEGKEEDEVG